MPLTGARSNHHDDGLDENYLVGLIGALLNHSEYLVPLTDLRARLLSQAARSERTANPPPLRCGAIQDAVIRVLAEADDPMRVTEVHAAVERVLSMRVSKDSVNSCLSTRARGADPLFVRVKFGHYRLRVGELKR